MAALPCPRRARRSRAQVAKLAESIRMHALLCDWRRKVHGGAVKKPDPTFDDAMLAYMDAYYDGSDAQSACYRSCPDPRGLLEWHKKLIVWDVEDLNSDFRDPGHCVWLVRDGSTPRQLIAKAAAFRDGFAAFLGLVFATGEIRQILTDVEQEKRRHVQQILSAAHSLSLELDLGAVLPPKPEYN
jgi:hypothetical protein